VRLGHGDAAWYRRAVEGTPRIPPLPEGEWDDLLRMVVESSPGGAADPPNVFTTLARAPEIFRGFIAFGAAMRNGRLSPRAHELVILRTAHNAGSEYEWTHHVPMAAAAGVGEEEIERLRHPVAGGGWSAEEAALLAAADELYDGTLSDAGWDALRERFGDAETIELIMLVGEYRLLATALSALRVQLEH
jgi:4-carboxymuconolactone decarboxylase